MDPIAAALIYILDWWLKTCKSHTTEPGISNISYAVLSKRSIFFYEVCQMCLAHLRGHCHKIILLFYNHFPLRQWLTQVRHTTFVASSFCVYPDLQGLCTKTSTFDAILCTYSPHSIPVTQEKKMLHWWGTKTKIKISFQKLWMTNSPMINDRGEAEW